MKRLLSITLVLLMLVSMLSGCGAKSEADYVVSSPAAAPDSVPAVVDYGLPYWIPS